MLYGLFKKKFFEGIKYMSSNDAKRIPTLKLAEGVHMDTFRYVDDLEPLHMYNVFKKENANTDNLPLIIDVHGGAWIYGDKDLNNPFCYSLCARNYNVVSLSYRLVTTCELKEQVQDIFTFMHHIFVNKDKLGLNFKNVMLTGDSAGGHLIFLCYIINQREDLQKLYEVEKLPFNIDVLALNHAATDLVATTKVGGNKFINKHVIECGIYRKMYGKGYKNKEIYQKSYCPEVLLTDEVKLNNLLIITSKADGLCHPSNLALKKLLESKHIEFTWYNEEADNCSHVFNVLYPDEVHSKKCNDFMCSFFQKKLNK